jgi:hypothetical protein
MNTLLDNLPLWAIFLLLVCLLILAYEIGFRIGLLQKANFEGGSRSQAGVVVGSLFALSAFFLAFTFNSVNARFDARKQLVVEEANVIGTTYLRSQLLPEPHRTDLLVSLERYVDLRLQGAGLASKADAAAFYQILSDSEELLDTLWQQVLSLNGLDNVDPVIRGLFIEAVNEVIDTHTRRVTVGVHARLPTIILISVGFAVVLGMLVLGYQGGLAGIRSVFVIISLTLALSFVCILIVSLDRPKTSLFDINQQAMQDLKATMSQF